MKPQTVHKFAGDDPSATRTACGLVILKMIVPHLWRVLVVDADVRRVTCGNCARTLKVPGE